MSIVKLKYLQQNDHLPWGGQCIVTTQGLWFSSYTAVPESPFRMLGPARTVAQMGVSHWGRLGYIPATSATVPLRMANVGKSEAIISTSI